MKDIILVGAPNVGKTTLFNWMTGRNQRVVNYPGSTVDFAVGDVLPVLGDQMRVYDSPGTYSLFPKSPEEEVTLKLLKRNDGNPACLVVVVDSTQIERQTALIGQMKELGLPIVVAMTMSDLHAEKEFPRAAIENFLKVPVVAIDGRLGGGVQDLVNVLSALKDQRHAPSVTSWSLERYQNVFRDSAQFFRSLFTTEISTRRRTDKIDSYVLHPVFGFAFFVLTMVLVFSSIFWAAAPMMDIIDGFFSFLIEAIGGLVSAPLLSEFLSTGVVASLGSVLIFVPQIFILFVAISILEDSGYLSRAAALVDRPLNYFGLNGRSFVPILSGFACAVPGIMAARTISSSKARWLTVFILPLMTCSARLPVYALLLSFLFLGKSSFLAGLSLAVLYIGALVIGLIAAKILSKFVEKTKTDFFIMELPLYRRPSIKSVLINATRRTKHYVAKSGPIIFLMAALLWVAATFPRYDLEGPARLEASWAGQAGQILEPAMAPMGGDWRVGVSLISAFAAREVFVSSLAVVLNINASESDDDGLQDTMVNTMQGATIASSGQKLFTLASVAALIVFFMIALQCTSTVAVVIREMGSWRYGVFQLVAMNIVAYILAVGTFQVLRAFGFDT